jgi:hypothetical protein
MITIIIGFCFIVGAAMAKIGFGIAQRTTDSYGVSTVEKVDGIICGCMTGLAVVILTVTQMVMALNGGNYENIPLVIPGLLAGFVGMAAGFVALNQARKQGQFDQPTRHPAPAPEIPADSKTCPYCSKAGISPQATSCPNCGQPFD